MPIARRFRILFPLLGALAAAVAASGARAADDPPEFVQRLIRRFESRPLEASPRSIVRYEYRGEAVYYVPVSPTLCCDIASRLYDSRGVLICAPDGGFTGRGDGKCADFAMRRSGRTVVWSDPRLQQEAQAAKADDAARAE